MVLHNLEPLVQELEEEMTFLCVCADVAIALVCSMRSLCCVLIKYNKLLFGSHYLGEQEVPLCLIYFYLNIVKFIDDIYFFTSIICSEL